MLFNLLGRTGLLSLLLAILCLSGATVAQTPAIQTQTTQIPKVIEEAVPGTNAGSSGSGTHAALYNRVYQIIIIETETNNKSSLGSGFQISDEGLVITNYHVISDLVFKPDHHRAEFVDQNQQKGDLELLSFDVINDLAILRKTDGSAPSQSLELAAAPPTRGDPIYSLGNPYDIGMLMVTGAYNGLAENSYNDQILFSGSLNAGMSGGPTLNQAGEVVGVNVSAAGSQLSFLVPVDKVYELIPRSQNPLPPEQYLTEVSRQVEGFQKGYFAHLMTNEWEPKDLGDHAQVPGEMGLDTSCWGRSNEDHDDPLYKFLSLSCSNSNHIYLTSSLNTGVLHYSFFYNESDKISSYRFHQISGTGSYSPDNRAGNDDVTPYQCQQSYLDPDTTGGSAESQDQFIQTGFCTRAYLNLEGLYDVLFYSVNAAAKRSLTTHFTLAGVSRETATGFTARFMEQAQWK